MPKQIVVANKSRAQKVKVHFRQSPFPGRADKLYPVFRDQCYGPSVVRQNRVFTESVKCMTFPGTLAKLLVALLASKVPGLRPKTKEFKKTKTNISEEKCNKHIPLGEMQEIVLPVITIPFAILKGAQAQSPKL